MSSPLILSVDGGNSKTYLALLRADGELLALVRGTQSSPHHLGGDGCLRVLDGLLGDACRSAGIALADAPAAVGAFLLAGVDYPSEEEEITAALAAQGWAARTIVGNDTFAVLRAGTAHGWGVAVVCGAGINCVGVARDGRQVRFPALGSITGDWGGGYDVGLAAVSAAARSEDGRGPRTSLEQAVPAHFGVETPAQLAESIHRREIPMRAVIGLAPVVFAEAADDSVAAEIVDHLAAEVVNLARVALERLGLTDEIVEVMLGGGMFRSRDARLLGAIDRGLRGVGPGLSARVTDSPPIVGAALLGLDAVGGDSNAATRIRAELGAAVERLEQSAGGDDDVPAGAYLGVE
jgi:N-acetylglucosamine kinase-like BadF-type ATPase